MYYIYIIRCMDNTLYTGITTDVKRRFSEHCTGKNISAKYTRVHKPVCIEAAWESENRSVASKTEALIKKLKKEDKEKLILEPVMLNTLYEDKFGSAVLTYAGEYKKFALDNLSK